MANNADEYIFCRKYFQRRSQLFRNVYFYLKTNRLKNTKFVCRLSTKYTAKKREKTCNEHYYLKTIVFNSTSYRVRLTTPRYNFGIWCTQCNALKVHRTKSGVIGNGRFKKKKTFFSSRTSGNDVSCSAVAVRQIGWDNQLPLLANAHLCQSHVPSFDYLSYA